MVEWEEMRRRNYSNQPCYVTVRWKFKTEHLRTHFLTLADYKTLNEFSEVKFTECGGTPETHSKALKT